MRVFSDTVAGHSLQPRLRVFADERMVLGWGKIMLLRQVAETGSISEAAKRMDISYNHAWSLIRTMNDCFRSPLVESSRGGAGGGGAILTDTGKKALALYDEMVAESVKASRPAWSRLRKLLRPSGEDTGNP